MLVSIRYSFVSFLATADRLECHRRSSISYYPQLIPSYRGIWAGYMHNRLLHVGFIAYVHLQPSLTSEILKSQTTDTNYGPQR